jgi:hypothetical protein
MRATFAANTLLQLIPREEAITNDAAISEKKNVWSNRFPELSLTHALNPGICKDVSHPIGVRADKTNNINVGIHVAALT